MWPKDHEGLPKMNYHTCCDSTNRMLCGSIDCVRYLLIALVALGSICGPASSTNLSFMPGDAYFSSTLSRKFLERLTNNGDVVMDYVPFKSLKDADFGGYAGFRELAIRGIDEQTRELLRCVYAELRATSALEVRIRRREDGGHEKYELNPFPMFIYNRNVNFDDQRLCMKYNETWMDIPADGLRGPDRGGFGIVPATDYEPIIRTYSGVVHDWKYASVFSGLNVEIPDGIAWGVAGRRIDARVAIDADRIQIVVLPDSDFSMYFERLPHAEFIVLTTDRAKHYTWDEMGKLTTKTWTKTKQR